MESFPQFTAGALAYADIFPAGLIPCRVVRVAEPGSGKSATAGRVVVRLTATRGAWCRGEIVTLTAGDCVPRALARVGKRAAIIDCRYQWR